MKNKRLIKPVPKSFFDSLRDSPEARYAAKHRLESGIQLLGQWQCDIYRKRKGLISRIIRKVSLGFFPMRPLISGGYPEAPNTFTYEGLDYLLDIIFYSTSKAAAKIWYVGLFDNNVTPAVANVASTSLGAAGTYGALQAADFDEDTYPSYNTAVAVDGVITNAANKAEFTIEAVTDTLYGAFLADSSDPTSTAGHLMAAKKFGTARAVVADDEIAVTYAITLSNA